MSDGDRFEAGLEMRRKVLGSAHVERSLAAATEFVSSFRIAQGAIDEYER